MKNNIVFKFLAILLCAASLLGIVGGAAGALVLAEGDLYNRTVDEMIDEQLRSNAAFFAEQTALSYASKELGGCPSDMVQRYGARLNYNYGYSILDAEGNVLESLNPELKDTAQVYSFPATGQYMHLVSVETETQKLARETAARIDSIGRGLESQDGQTVPAEGVSINQVIFTNKEGAPVYEAYGDQTNCHSIFYYGDDGNVRSNSLYEHEPRHQIGFLYYGANGQLIYRSFLEEWDHNFSTEEIGSVMFLSHESGFLFQTEDSDGLGILAFENGHLCFTAYASDTIPTESVPEETTPETTAETLETVPAETAPEETVTETQTVTETTAQEYTEAAEETWVEETEAWSEENWEEASSASAVPEEWENTEEGASEENYDAPAETAPPVTEPPVTEPPVTEPPVTEPPETVPEETLPEETQPLLINGKPLEFYQVNRYEFHDSQTGELNTAKYVYLTLPEMTVEVYADRSALGNAESYNLLRLVRQYRGYLLPAIGICLLVFAITMVYLCTAAGRKPKSPEVRASGLNRLPLDLYLGLGIFAGAGIIALGMAAEQLLERDFLLGCASVAAAAFAVCLLVVAYLFAFIAQCKTPGGYWWRNLLCIRFVFLCMRFMKWLERWLREKFLPWLGHLLIRLWNATVKFCAWTFHAWEKGGNWLIDKLGRFFRRIGRTLNRWFSLMPLTWQWITCGMLLFCMLLLAVNTHNEFLTLVCLAVSFALILYGAHCFGTLLESTRKMGRGDLDTKVDDRMLIGSFKEFAGDLNDLADVAVVAAQKQLKSERMKTELITNVSHDIKTPLTSIINYVDLLQKPHTEEEGQQYLEVLDRQSQRLKKLVEDLMDMSKASTGNMTVEITRVDAVESVNQALGEFADKLERARLYPVFRHADDSVPMMADGKLVWRVLSNLLGNAVKYAMPGTRVYLDLSRVGSNVVISIKNISRDELNVDAEELMERFVRGDVSRNTEGSGLGLNIAKSLMELQKGQLQMLVDGDLFKVTLLFPTAE